MSLPRIVCAETPDMTLRVAARIATSAVVVIADVHDDARTCSFGLVVVGIGIIDDEIAALRCGAADFIRLLHEPVEVGVADRPQHDHIVAERQKGIKYVPLATGNDMMPLKSESRAEPIDGGRHVAIAHGGHKP